MSMPAPGTEVTARISSVDTFRGLTILLMVFVNDLGRGAPSWMHHIRPPRADGMTLADIVFPFFLFIVGVSIPLALERSRAAGFSTWSQLGHILTRTAGLLLMGVIVLNSEEERTRRSGACLPTSRCSWPGASFPASRLEAKPIPGSQGHGRSGALRPAGDLPSRAESAEIPVPGPRRRLGVAEDRLVGNPGLDRLGVPDGLAHLCLHSARREWLMGALAILIMLHLAMQHGGVCRSDRHKPWLGAAAAISSHSRGDRGPRRLRRPGRRDRLARRDHHGRLPARHDPPPR